MLSKKSAVVIQILLLTTIFFSFTSTNNTQAAEDQNDKAFSTTDYKTTDPIVINGNDDFDPNLWNENGRSDGSECYPWILDGYNFTDVGIAITIDSVDDYFIIRNCLFKNIEDKGIYMTFTDNGRICNNSFDSCGGTWGGGIYMPYTHNIRIYNNTFSNCSHGIMMMGDYTYICGNDFYKNNRSIYAIDSNHVFIVGNQMNENDLAIDFVIRVKHSTVSHNTIAFSLYDGLKLTNSSWNDISRNVFQNNTEYGVKLINSPCNEITKNNFFFNNPYGISQGYDDLNITTWTYNYWTDLVGFESYDIDGPGQNKDYDPNVEISYIGDLPIDCQSDCDFCVITIYRTGNSLGILLSISSIVLLALFYIRRKKQF